MLEFLNQPISFKRRPSARKADAPAAAEQSARAQAPVATAQPVATRGSFLNQPISFKRRPSARSAEAAPPAEQSAPAQTPVVAEQPVATGNSLPSALPASAALPAAGEQPTAAAPAAAAAQAAPAQPPATERVRRRLALPHGRPRLVLPSGRSRLVIPHGRPRLSAPRGRRTANLVGLEIEPGQIVAVQSRLDGHVIVERAAGRPIPPSLVRDGEVSDVAALSEALAELFDGSGLDRRVRIGIANQRIVMRQIELPAITDPKELESAVHFQAQDEIPMPIESVVLDYHSLGVTETEAGPRLQVLLVAARRDMVERMLLAARQAGLRPEGVDLAAFGMIRALRPLDALPGEQVLYLSIGGLTNLAIANGSTCQFTRVITTGVEQIVNEVAASAGVPLQPARRLVSAVAANGAGVTPPPVIRTASGPVSATSDQLEIARTALGDGIRRIAAEVRNSLDFHRVSRGEQPVSRAVLTGPALDLTGFDAALSRELDLPITRGAVALASPEAAGHVPMSRLAVAAGLSLAEGVQ
jgi:type IV pilus assembly protein PilM